MIDNVVLNKQDIILNYTLLRGIYTHKDMISANIPYKVCILYKYVTSNVIPSIMSNEARPNSNTSWR